MKSWIERQLKFCLFSFAFMPSWIAVTIAVGAWSHAAQAFDTFDIVEIKKILRSTEDVWNVEFRTFGKHYVEPKLVLFSHSVRTACGAGLRQMGPFYCPLDYKIYLDPNFLVELRTRFHAPAGNFPAAFVISHEIGHHVQALLGIADQVAKAKMRLSEIIANRLQVRMELQADCMAGFWAQRIHSMQNRLESGDIQKGIATASGIGDDRVQRMQTGKIVPAAFTHGTSEQRMRWFLTGYEGSGLSVCDTFNVPNI